MIFSTDEEMGRFTYNFQCRGIEYIKRQWGDVKECYENITQLELGSEQLGYSLFYLPDLSYFPRLRHLSLQYCSQLKQLQIVNGLEYIRYWEGQKILTVYLSNNTSNSLLLTQNYAPKTLIFGEGCNWRVLTRIVNGAVSVQNVDTVIVIMNDVEELVQAVYYLDFARGVHMRMQGNTIEFTPTYAEIIQGRGFVVQ